VEKLLNNLPPRIRRHIVGIVGGVVLAAGIVMIPYPGPGWLVVFMGLAILSREFPWAQRENRSKISVNCDSKEEADKLFNGLSAGGEVEGPMGQGPWGSYAGMFRDKYGIEWIVEFNN
jgi:hypothetical protein